MEPGWCVKIAVKLHFTLQGVVGTAKACLVVGILRDVLLRASQLIAPPYSVTPHRLDHFLPNRLLRLCILPKYFSTSA